MKNQKSYLKSIHSKYPQFEVKTVIPNVQGQNSHILILNGDFIFRFPKYDHVLEKLKIEAELLRYLQGYLPIPIPNPEYQYLDQACVGEAFIGYRMLFGAPLWRDTFHRIQDPEVVNRIAAQVAGFLTALHSLKVHDRLSSKLPVYDTYEQNTDIYTRIRAKLYQYMRSDAQKWATAHFENFLDDKNNFDYERVLKHSDFGPSNILFDEKDQVISGVIDFGSSGWGDPAYDFAGLLSGYGEQFIESCSKTYPEVKDFIGRIRFYQGTFALLEALFGFENGDEDALNAGLAKYV